MSKFRFKKSSYSEPNGECVEVARNMPRTVAVRDSTAPRWPRRHRRARRLGRLHGRPASAAAVGPYVRRHVNGEGARPHTHRAGRAPCSCGRTGYRLKP
ncbi:DUF397 domain-containing protein [Streptomyces sp. CYG21]|uniref:DUF397 domain-containing protein n=1 Tax=Streptomyces sp. CYG21 TaxID=2838874 RepID=UPI0035ABBCB9